MPEDSTKKSRVSAEELMRRDMVTKIQNTPDPAPTSVDPIERVRRVRLSEVERLADERERLSVEREVTEERVKLREFKNREAELEAEERALKEKQKPQDSSQPGAEVPPTKGQVEEPFVKLTGGDIKEIAGMTPVERTKYFEVLNQVQLSNPKLFMGGGQAGNITPFLLMAMQRNPNLGLPELVDVVTKMFAMAQAMQPVAQTAPQVDLTEIYRKLLDIAQETSKKGVTDDSLKKRIEEFKDLRAVFSPEGQGQGNLSNTGLEVWKQGKQFDLALARMKHEAQLEDKKLEIEKAKFGSVEGLIKKVATAAGKGAAAGMDEAERDFAEMPREREQPQPLKITRSADPNLATVTCTECQAPITIPYPPPPIVTCSRCKSTFDFKTK